MKLLLKGTRDVCVSLWYKVPAKFDQDHPCLTVEPDINGRGHLAWQPILVRDRLIKFGFEQFAQFSSLTG
ncbi:hypothetical protein NX05_15755 [Xanthomonas vasicola]|nr:hypothetical protein NX05_15755 [Xanthomonas vasicola]